MVVVRRAVVGLIVAAAILTGCSSGGASASPVATAAVDLPASYRFAPAAITVPAGTTVTWTNDDRFTHSVQFLDGGLPSDQEVMDPGVTATFTFAQPGVYQCEYHLHPQD